MKKCTLGGEKPRPMFLDPVSEGWTSYTVIQCYTYIHVQHHHVYIYIYINIWYKYIYIYIILQTQHITIVLYSVYMKQNKQRKPPPPVLLGMIAPNFSASQDGTQPPATPRRFDGGDSMAKKTVFFHGSFWRCRFCFKWNQPGLWWF